MGSIEEESKKPHAVMIPYPAQGHITPMLKLAKLLHFKGFHITFVNTEFNHKRLLKSRGPNALDGLSDFRFETIPDGLPPSDPDATQDIPSLCVSINRNCPLPFQNLLQRLNADVSSPPITCVVSDGVMAFTVEVAEQLDLPTVFLWTTSACGFLGYVQYPYLVEKGITPLQDESYLKNGYLDTVIDWVPGMKNIRLKDLPTFIRTTDPNDEMVNYVLGEIKRSRKARAIILNTFDPLEKSVLEDLSSIYRRVYTVGPLNLLVKQVPENKLSSVGSNLWKEETECLEWLDSKEPSSVVYVNFGSITVMTPDQLIEFAWGLANSKIPFLWIIRRDLVKGETRVLTSEFVEETKGRGTMLSWCPQEQVLNHPSIGGFLTHSGWNSTIESLSSGVPMICWPFFAEQQMNCRFSCTEWGVGMEIDNNVKREDVEKQVRELMEGEKGSGMRNKATEWKRLGEEAIGEGGSSFLNLDKLVNEVLLSTSSST